MELKPNVEVITEYGYPLLRITDPAGVYNWFYPQTPTSWSPVEPSLIRGWPSSHFKDGWKICVFMPEGSMAPIVMHIEKAS